MSCYLNAMLEAVKFPTGIADLDTGLTNVDGNALSHFLRKTNGKNRKKLGKLKILSGVYEDAFRLCDSDNVSG